MNLDIWYLLLARLDCFLETIFPLLDFLRSFLTRPPAVLCLVPFQTCHFLPTTDFFLAFLAFLFLGAAFFFLQAFLQLLDLFLLEHLALAFLAIVVRLGDLGELGFIVFIRLKIWVFIWKNRYILINKRFLLVNFQIIGY